MSGFFMIYTVSTVYYNENNTQQSYLCSGGFTVIIYLAKIKTLREQSHIIKSAYPYLNSDSNVQKYIQR